MKQRNLTCIVCPKGCPISVTLGDDGHVETVTGNTCVCGLSYAEAECSHPERVVTSTVRTNDGFVVPCKTASPVPKEKIFAVMEEINGKIAPAVLHIGDVVIENVAKTGVSVVATANKDI